MYARKVTADQIETAARNTPGVTLYEFRPSRAGFRFTLRPDHTKQWQRRSPSGRRVWATCWHGHRAFMRALFAIAPDAVLETAMATYRGADDFERHHNDTQYRNVGSMMQPAHYGDTCDC